MEGRPHPKKIVLNSTEGYCHSGWVIFVGVVGKDCEKIEDMIDELCVGDASNPYFDMLTSSHPGQSVEEALAFANSLTLDFAGAAEVIDTSPASHNR